MLRVPVRKVVRPRRTHWPINLSLCVGINRRVLNAESLATSKILSNQEIHDLVETLGTGIGQGFDMHKLRYHRVILLMDADSDGYHISTLLLAFFFRHMPQLIRGEKLYLALPPLYRIAVGQDSHYARDDAHREEILATLPKNHNFEISRFKGLGEMTAQQLKVTTLDPKTRILLRVDIESQLETDTTAEFLANSATQTSPSYWAKTPPSATASSWTTPARWMTSTYERTMTTLLARVLAPTLCVRVNPAALRPKRAHLPLAAERRIVVPTQSVGTSKDAPTRSLARARTAWSMLAPMLRE